MDSETIETVTEWSSEPYSGGYGGLRDLAGREFTGAVTDGTAWLFVLNGRFVGVSGGDIESFEDADGTAYAAPDPSLPLLFAMREEGGETRAKYYTNDTPLSEVDRTLSAGNFTGYVELSENVLSGDYFLVYHGGRRLACAFVGTGSSPETLTGEEAFERADDEVGIYEVRTVGVEVLEVPEPAEPDDLADATATEAADVAATDPDETGGAGSGAASAGPRATSEADSGTDETDAPRTADAGTDADGVTIDAAGGPAAMAEDPADATATEAAEDATASSGPDTASAVGTVGDGTTDDGAADDGAVDHDAADAPVAVSNLLE
jgi:hypothetical protein